MIDEGIICYCLFTVSFSARPSVNKCLVNTLSGYSTLSLGPSR